MPTPEPAHETTNATLTRRTLVVGSTVGAVALGSGVAAQPATPAAIDLEAFRQLNLTITGADTLDDEGLQQLLDLFLADEQMTEALHTLLAEQATNADFDVRTADFSLVIVVTNILQFWYLGNFRNEPLPNRPQRVARLTSYAALPYFTAPAVCKAFGYWTTDPGLE